ncbi:hypothetical protein KJ657_03375 [Patescibacteria group bacterium]|nr:hypothetical protein [Patescibacteria group bacterium]MBU1016105.1 hypothetical protein [Patescibacteria group bacterium]MBU1684848.1 hypothetical protein [Patescibacteria group bacterium]MBU1938564.1 hypothetical protein [Patescibacteria group bacterium]
MNFRETKEFENDFKKLNKKFRSLPEDLERLKKLLTKEPLGVGKHFAVLHNSPSLSIVKARLACKYLKNSTSSLRVIYAYHEETKEIELIEFIELYFKSSKAREDFARLQEYLKAHKS